MKWLHNKAKKAGSLRFMFLYIACSVVLNLSVLGALRFTLFCSLPMESLRSVPLISYTFVPKNSSTSEKPGSSNSITNNYPAAKVSGGGGTKNLPKVKGVKKHKAFFEGPPLESKRSGKESDLEHKTRGVIEKRVLGPGDTGYARKQPKLMNGVKVKVPYPVKAKQLLVEGVVRLRLTVSESGKVIEAQVLSGPEFGLKKAALLVSKKLQFLPATDEQGHPKTAQVDHEVIFRLK